jgi:hypothetical protein
LDRRRPAHLLTNLIGSVLLAYLAVEEQQWGFLPLEADWASVPRWSLVAHSRRGATDATR